MSNEVNNSTLNWHDLESAILSAAEITLNPIDTRENRKIPVTSSFVLSSPKFYKNSPKANSISRKLLNTFLFKLKETGLFLNRRWLDVGGRRDYGHW